MMNNFNRWLVGAVSLEESLFELMWQSRCGIDRVIRSTTQACPTRLLTCLQIEWVNADGF